MGCNLVLEGELACCTLVCGEVKCDSLGGVQECFLKTVARIFLFVMNYCRFVMSGISYQCQVMYVSTCDLV